MTHCEKCIHHDICKIDSDLMPEDFVNFFPHNEDCKQFKSAAKVVEVRHGEWQEIVQCEDVAFATCSVCGDRGRLRTERSGIWYINNPYCPSCGADMRGDNNA